MRAFLANQWKLIAFLVVIALWLSLFPIWSRWVTANPLDEAITLAPRGAINREIRVVIPEHYDLNLVFERANIPFEELKTLLGDWAYKDGKPIPSGMRVPIRWILKTVSSGSVVASGEIDSFGTITWSSTEVYRQVGHLRVAPGRYIFSAEILGDVPELAHIKTRLSMELHPKASSTWQITFAFWGSIANFFLVWPAAVIIVLMLLWRAFLIFHSKGNAANDTPRADTPGE